MFTKSKEELQILIKFMRKEILEQRKNIADILKEQEGLVIIYPQEKWQAPPNFNYRALEWLDISEEEFKDWVEKITTFINKPMIVDRFDRDHDARRQWRSEMEIKYGEEAGNFIRYNKLRKTSSPMNVILANLEINLKKTENPKKQDVELTIREYRTKSSEAVSGNYDTLGIEEKKNALQKLDIIVKKFLEDLQK